MDNPDDNTEATTSHADRSPISQHVTTTRSVDTLHCDEDDSSGVVEPVTASDAQIVEIIDGATILAQNDNRDVQTHIPSTSNARRKRQLSVSDESSQKRKPAVQSSTSQQVTAEQPLQTRRIPHSLVHSKGLRNVYPHHAACWYDSRLVRGR